MPPSGVQRQPPEINNITGRRTLRYTGNTGRLHIKLVLANRGHMLSRVAIDESQLNRVKAPAKGLDEIGKKARSQRRENADPDMAVFAATDGGNFSSGKPDLGQGLAPALHELLACVSEFDAA